MEAIEKKEYKEFESQIIAELSALLPNLKYRMESDIEVGEIVYLEISGPNPVMRDSFWLKPYFYAFKYGDGSDKTIKEIALEIAEEYLEPQRERSFKLISEAVNAFAKSHDLFESKFYAFSPEMVRDAYEDGELSEDDLHIECLSPSPFQNICENDTEWTNKVFAICKDYMRVYHAVCLATDSINEIPRKYPKNKPVDTEEPREKWRQTLYEELEKLQASAKDINEVFAYVYTETMACNSLYEAEKMFGDLLDEYEETKRWNKDELDDAMVRFIRAAAVKVFKDYEESAAEMMEE